jgi:lysozyme family protein
MTPTPNAARDRVAWRAMREPSEGGLSIAPQDPGNWYAGELIGSNRGVTGPVLAQWLHRPITAADIAELTPDTADLIADALYWRPCGGDYLPSGVNLMVADFGWGSGVTTAARQLQVCLGFAGRDVDGIVGPKTVAAASQNVPQLIPSLYGAQTAFYRSLQNATYLNGWLNRAAKRRDAAEGLV